MGEQAGADARTIVAVSIKMPAFTPDDPDIFFIAAEAQFETRSPPITADRTKFFHIVGSLPPNVLSRIKDLIKNPPANDAYDALKTRLTQTFAAPPEERALKIIENNSLGGRRPSALLDYLLSLAEDETIDFIIRAAFLRSLPNHIAELLRNSTADLRALATEADKHFTASGVPIAPSHGGIHAVDEVVGSATDSSIDSSAVNAVNHAAARGGSRNAAPQGKNLCYFHERFGAAAKKCRAPCAMAPPEKANRSQHRGNYRAGEKW